jgi:hypothetical protein
MQFPVRAQGCTTCYELLQSAVKFLQNFTRGCTICNGLLHRALQLVTNFCTELYSLLEIFAQSYTISYELLHRGVRLVITCAQGSTPISVEQHLSLGSHFLKQKISPRFMDPKISLRCLQQPIFPLYPDQINPTHTLPLYLLRSILILSPNLQLSLRNLLWNLCRALATIIYDIIYVHITALLVVTPSVFVEEE